jgi:SPP1 gp7 family putative phage head morphogenesis protein
MNKLAASFNKLRGGLGSLIAGKGWRQAWAAGLDADGTGHKVKLDRPYEQSVWVFRAIQHVAGPLAERPLKFQRPADSTDASDPERDSFWSRPARSIEGTMSRSDFIEATVAWMQLKGQAFWIMDDSWFERGNGPKNPLILARPDRMRPIKHGEVLLGWEYLDGGGVRYALTPIQVCRPRYYNPYDELAGLAPWMPAQLAAESDYAAATFAKNLMVNNGDRGPFVIAQESNITDAQRIQIETMLRQKRELSRRGIYKTAFISGNVKIEDPKVQATDADFVAQRLENRHEIFIAFGVPASMAQVTASYSVGSASDRFRLVEETCMPLGGKLADHIERVERMRSGDDLQAVFDWNGHSTMKQVRQELVKSAKDLFSMGVPVTVINDFLDMGLPRFEGDEVGYLPMSLDPVGKSHAPKKSTAKEPQDKDDAAKEAKAARESLAELKGLFMQRITEPRSTPPDEQRQADDKREQLWNKHMRLREPHVRAMRNQVGKALAEVRQETLSKIEAAKQLATVKASGVLEMLFNLDALQMRLVELLEGPLTGAIKDAVAQFNTELALDDPWVMEDPEVSRFLGTRANFIKDAAEEVWTDVRDELQEGVDAGESNAKLAERIRAKFTGLSKHRSEVIAQTETGIAYGHARQQAMQATGVEYKEWLTARDDKVRAEHVKADKQTVPVDEPFTVAGEELMGPCDSKGSPENIINCRCIAIPRRKPKE